MNDEAIRQAPADASFSKLPAFLRANLDGFQGDISIERAAGGQSNPTFFVTSGQRRIVLRARPGGELLPSAHAIDREYRIINALAGSSVPVPKTILYHADGDVIGTAFYLMERVDGRIFHDASLPGTTAPERHRLFQEAAETLGRLHAINWRSLGLADFGREGGFFERQVARWTRQWQLSTTRPLPAVDRLIDWLPRHLPRSDLTTVVHGDFRFGNLVVHTREPRIVGVLDWELSTLGHPLADLAHTLTAWHSTPGENGGLRGVDLAACGIPSEEEFADRYYASCGHTARLERFHLAFALFRFAVIFEGIAARERLGNAVAGNARLVGELAPVFAERALAIADAAPAWT